MRYVDCLQVGARNMQNFDLLKELGKVRRPVLLKRGLSATIEEWLLMARAAIAAGADGLLIEVHNNPEKALSDGPQSLYPEQFDRLMSELRIIAPVLGRTLPLTPVSPRR